jgi:membrane protein implicated in regulation of membrane protease activity
MATPDKKDRRRPLELLGLSALLAVFMLIVVFMGSRDAVLALEFAGVGFIVALVVLAMLALASKPQGAEQADLDEQNSDPEDRPRGH